MEGVVVVDQLDVAVKDAVVGEMSKALEESNQEKVMDEGSAMCQRSLSGAAHNCNTSKIGVLF